MDKKKIWLSSPHMGDQEFVQVKEAFDSNWIAPVGPHVNEFEELLSGYTGVRHVAALSSGTAALHLAMILLDVKIGDYVVCQSKTFSATANSVAYQGAAPVFVDSEPDTWNMDPGALEDALKNLQKSGRRPKAILPVHLYGMPAKMKEINTVAEHYGIPVVEDAAEALGSTYFGAACGSLGYMGVLSFNGNKIITTSSGGALLCNDEALVHKARFLATQARDAAPHYQHSHIGYNYRMSNILASIGCGQMQILPQRIAVRRANFDRYRAYFEAWNHKGFDIRFQEEQDGMFSNRWLSCIYVDPTVNQGLTREYIHTFLNTYHIETRPLWKPMHLQPVFKDALYFGGQTSERLFEHGLCLPSGSNLTEAEWQRILEALDACLDSFPPPPYLP